MHEISSPSPKFGWRQLLTRFEVLWHHVSNSRSSSFLQQERLDPCVIVAREQLVELSSLAAGHGVKQGALSVSPSG